MRRVVLLVLFGLSLGGMLTGIAGALPGSQDLNALNWLATVATIAALVVAVGIYQVQQSQSDTAHRELLDALKAQDEILQDLADATAGGEPRDPESPTGSTKPQRPKTTEPPTTEDRRVRAERPGRLGQLERLGPGDPDEALTAAQRGAVEAQYGQGAIDAAWQLGADQGNRPRLVRLVDGTLVSVTNPDPNGRIRVREVRARHDARGDQPRQGHARGLSAIDAHRRSGP